MEKEKILAMALAAGEATWLALLSIGRFKPALTFGDRYAG